MGTIVIISGLCVSGLTGVSAALVGLQEANDPEHAKLDDLTEFEKDRIDRNT